MRKALGGGIECRRFGRHRDRKRLGLHVSCCRGRDRTSTEQLVVAQSSVVDPGRVVIANQTALCYIYPVISTPETRGHVCLIFHHPTVCCSKNDYIAILSQSARLLQIIK